MSLRSSSRPVVVASANGHQFTNGGAQTCVERAFALLSSGADVLEALVAGVTIVELDPGDSSVGYGGLPNADGVVQLDACCMHGPRRRAGGVAALEGIATAAAVARQVMDETPHHLLVGGDAQRFARDRGFAVSEDLNSPRSRALWLEWKRRMDARGEVEPARRMQAGYDVGAGMTREGLIDSNHLWGTINCNGVNPKGEVCGVTTTSGLPFKIPGRVGDSPILGAGLYVDGEVGAAGSTGRGESNLLSLGSFLIVESMRSGMSPKDAGMKALKRVAALTVEKRLLNGRGQPNFNVNYYILDAKGQSAGVALYASRYALCTESGPQTLEAEALFPGTPGG